MKLAPTTYPNGASYVSSDYELPGQYDRRMSQSAGESREELYRNWLDWVTANLGRDSELAVIAATAATDAAERGRGFNGAIESAKTAWNEAARLEVEREQSTEWATIDHDRTEPRAVIALASALAVWPWPILTVVLLVAGRLGLSVDTIVFGSWMAIVDVGTIPAFSLVAVVFGHWARRRIKRFGLRGGSYSTAGLTLGYVTLLGSPVLIGLVWFVWFVIVHSFYV